MLVRSDCTTRNKRKAAALSLSYDGSRNASPTLVEQEELDRIRPDLDGNEIMQLLGIPPGPLVGKAWKFMLEVRMDEGPLDPEEARKRLREWAREQAIEPSQE